MTNEVIEEIDYLSDEVLKSLTLPSSIKMYINEIITYPILSVEETLRLNELAKNGDKRAREKLINSNLRLVIKPAKKYSKNLTHLHLLDIIQAGNEGLIKAIDKYDPTLGALSTYALTYIEGYIKRAINTSERSIHRSDEINSLVIKYLKLCSKYTDLNRPLPSDEIFCDLLNITIKELKEIRSAIQQTEVSLNKKLDETDNESNEAMDYIKTYETGYDSVLNDMSYNELLIILKERFTPLEYFILYYRFISEPLWTLDEVAENLGMSREQIRQDEIKLKTKIKPYLEENSKTYKRTKEKIMATLKGKIYRIKTSPLTPNDITMFLYLKKHLTELESNILYLILIEKYNYTEEELARKNGISIETLKAKIKLIKAKFTEALKSEYYEKFKAYIIATYKKNIFTIDLKNDNIEYIDKEYLDEKYGNLKIEELISLCGIDIYKSLDPNSVKLLERYLGTKRECKTSYYAIEEYINRIHFGYKRRNTKLNPNVLYKTFRRNLDSFSEEQILYLECFYFNKKDKSEFKKKYPNSKPSLPFLENRLEKLYFNIYKYFWTELTKEEYLLVRKKHRKTLGEERLKILDMHFGVNQSPLSFKEISSILNLPLSKVASIINTNKIFCKNILTKRTTKKQIDKEIYKKYIQDIKYTITDETRMILTLHVIEEKSYEEISKITNLTQNRIANIVISGIRRLDLYRYEILKPETISKEELDEFYKEYSSSLSELDKQITELKFIKNLSNEKISEILKIDKSTVKTKVKRISALLKSNKIKKMNITIDDVEIEINKHPSESILTELEKTILSFHYGIKCKYNKDNEKLRAEDISKRLNISTSSCLHHLKDAKDKLKLLKIGAIKPETLFISREKLNLILDDPHLPITEEEKEIICKLLELKGYTFLTLDELSKKLNIKKDKIKRKYELAILTIYKYLNGEVEGKLNYEIDIEPILKYFNKTDRLLIKEYYKEGLSFNDISKKYNLSFSTIANMFDRIFTNIYGILNNPNYNKFDFIFYETAVNNPNLPYNGNLSLAKQAFELFINTPNFKKMSIPEIINYLNLNMDPQTLMKMIYDLMISVCKLKIGITKEKSFTKEEVEDYYNRHKHQMTTYRNSFYIKYFKKYKKSSHILIPKEIVYDLMKEKIPDLFNVRTAKKEEVREILKAHYSEIPRRIREYLMTIFDLNEREFMSGKEKAHVYRILHRIDRRINMKIEEQTVEENTSEAKLILTNQ